MAGAAHTKAPSEAASKAPEKVTESLPSTDDVKHNIDDHYDLAIRIKVGRDSDAKEFDLHRGVLKFYSGYFRAAIKNIEDGNFSEASNGMIELPDESPGTFILFRRWLYAPDRKLARDLVTFDWKALSFPQLCRLWTFSERRIIPALQNRVMDLIISKMSQRDVMSPEALQCAYTETASGSLLRKIVCFYHAQGRYFIKNIDAKWFEEPFFQSFAIDVTVMRATTAAMKDSERLEWDRCAYHVHEQGIKCVEKGWKTY